MELSGLKVLVFGSGRSGIGAAKLLCETGASPVIFDGNTAIDEDAVRAAVGENADLPVYKGELPENVRRSLDLVVLSPGVPCDLPFVQQLRGEGIPIWGEVELAWQTTKGRVLAITGTNGKTTTTALLGHIMEDALPGKVFVVGNIGTAYTSRSLQTEDDSVTVAEISSFQLETIQDFAPKVTAILNITEDHLNRHHTMEEYIRVKEEVTRNQQPQDVCVLNHEDSVLRAFGQRAVPRVFWFSSAVPLEEGIFLDGGRILLRDGGKEYLIAETSRLKLLGVHNYENVMAAAAMAYFAGVDPAAISRSVCTFTAVPHRIEFVEEIDGVAYYNDSKGTNPDAAIKGIQAMTRPTLLIGGGYDKQSSYDEWIRSFDGKVRYLVLIGQTKEKIKEAALENGFTDIILCEDLAGAVETCRRLARPGDAVLLSPACASWGQFDNYEQRGDVFKGLVRDMK